MPETTTNRQGNRTPGGTLTARYPGHALVTGASSGIGAALCRQLAAEGVPLVLVGRREAALTALAEELVRQHAIDAIAIPCDLAAADADARLVEQLRARAIRVGMLFNNAGFGTDGSDFSDVPLQRMLDMVTVHCRATLALTHRLLPDMLAQGRGCVVFTSSVAAYQPTPGFAVYGASKAFELSLAEALWAELAPRGIDVLALSPGVTDTDFFRASGRERVDKEAMSAASVAFAALEALGRDCSVVPGWKNRLKASAHRLLPRKTVARLALRMARSHAASAQD